MKANGVYTHTKKAAINTENISVSFKHTLETNLACGRM